MKTSQKLWAISFMAVILIPNMVSIIAGKESFPYTNAPMFAHYIGPGTNFYDVKFIAADGKKQVQVFPSYGATNYYGHLKEMRFFFSKIYGPAEPASPFGYFQNDTPEKLEQRLTKFFIAYFPYTDSALVTPEIIRLEIEQYNHQNKFLSAHEIGYYDLQKKRFYHTWKPDTK